MRISDRGLIFIAGFEGFGANRYNDPAGHCTVGYGHLIHYGNCDGRASEQPFINGISKAQALRLLETDVVRYVACVDRLITVPLNQNQVDALVSFTFNVGCGALETSTLRRILNAGDYAGVCEQLKRWVKADGRTLGGLIRRRAEECELFNVQLALPSPPPVVIPVLDEEEDDMANTLVRKEGDSRVLYTNGVRSWHVPSPKVFEICKKLLGMRKAVTIPAPLWDALWDRTQEK